jgi:hypothetical protein
MKLVELKLVVCAPPHGRTLAARIIHRPAVPTTNQAVPSQDLPRIQDTNAADIFCKRGYEFFHNNIFKHFGIYYSLRP